MTDETPAATIPDNAAGADTSTAQPEPPPEPRWRRFVKPFLITLAFTVVVDLGSSFLTSRAGEPQSGLQVVKRFGESIEYGLESVNVFALLRRGNARLSNDRDHDGLIETVLGLPDAARYALACAWEGADRCDATSAGQQPRSNWFGKLLLVAVALFSLAATFDSDRSQQDEAPAPLYFVGVFLISLFYAGMFCAVVMLAMRALASLGLWLSGVWAALAGFPAAVWVFAALKDLASDQVKGFVAKKV